MTNYDRIKAMSVEALACTLMCPANYDWNFNKKSECNGEMNRDCLKCTMDWLQSEAEE